MDQGDRMIVVDGVGPERELKFRPARRRDKLRRVKKLVGVAVREDNERTEKRTSKRWQGLGV